MNAHIQIPTLTPEQQANLDWFKQNLDSNLESTQELFMQLASLFAVIEELSKKENFASRFRIKNLAGLGQFNCENWEGFLDQERGDISKFNLNQSQVFIPKN